jgi:hypothetical protein
LAAYDPTRTGVGSVSPRFWHIPASGLGGGRVVDAARPVALVFARYDAASTTAVRAVHPAEAARLLLADSPDAGRYGPGALRVTVDLVSTIPCVELTFSASAEAIAAVRDLVRQSQVTTADHPVAELAGSAPASAPRATPTAVDRGAVLGRAEGVSGVLVGSRCLVWREGGEIVELDEVGTVWMQLLDGVTPLGELIDEVVEATGTDPGATTTSVLATVRGLAALGVVA